ncbi:hypothetical protein JA9_002226 [Meyerozyma sp. JA9]|nr:hypothetical protein JA9_002226 [Meyerozyma sp. JA9]
MLSVSRKCPVGWKMVHTMASRTIDKQHRLMYRTLEREKTRYKKTKIALNPRMRDLLVYLHKYKDGNVHHVHLKGPSRQANHAELLEAVVFHIIIALHCINNSIPVDQSYTAALEEIKGRKAGSRLSSEDINSNIRILVETFTHKNEGAHSQMHESQMSHLRLSLQIFSILSDYKFSDLVSWIGSVSAPSVLDSCKSLATLTAIPPFVTSDILLRTPMSPADLQLQMDVWYQFMADITTGYHRRYSHLKDIIDNLLFYCVVHDTSLLPELLHRTLGHLTGKNKAFHFPFVNSEYLNRLMWTLAFDFTRISNQNQLVKSVVSAQEIIVKNMAAVGNVRLNLEGHMGVVLAVNSISQSKARRFFTIAEQKFLDGSVLSSREASCYNFTKTYLSETPESLLDTFNSCAVDSFHSASLWFAFVTKLRQFDLMTATRSKKILEELVKHSDRLLITKDILSVLLYPLQSLKSMHEFMQILGSGQAGHKLVAAHVSVLTPKYLAVLYSNPETDVVPDRLWDLAGEVKALQLARHIYARAKKTPKLVGIMLNGEAALHPQRIYDLYKSELTDRGLFPDEQCLHALIVAASSSSESVPMWGNLYAPQVAIREYNIFTAASDKRSSRYLRVSDRLWQRYIAMLVQFDYNSELATILQRWVEIEFHPSPETLMALLRALPVDFASRCIGHFEKLRRESIGDQVKGPSSWSWPSVEEMRQERM